MSHVLRDRPNLTVRQLGVHRQTKDLPGSLLSDQEKKSFADHTAIGRWGDPKELVGTLLLLATDAGSYITGTTIVVDGGFVVR